MTKKTEIPVNDPSKTGKVNTKKEGQRPTNYTKEEIKAQETDQYNPNNGPDKRSKKKFDKNG